MRIKTLVMAGALGVFGAGGLGYVIAHTSGASCCAPRVAHAEAAPPSATAKSVTLHIEGVSCASCAVGIKRALRALEGVSDVQMTDKSAVVQYDPAKLSPAQMIAAVEKVGFKARVA